MMSDEGRTTNIVQQLGYPLFVHLVRRGAALLNAIKNQSHLNLRSGCKMNGDGGTSRVHGSRCRVWMTFQWFYKLTQTILPKNLIRKNDSRPRNNLIVGNTPILRQHQINLPLTPNLK